MLWSTRWTSSDYDGLTVLVHKYLCQTVRPTTAPDGSQALTALVRDRCRRNVKLSATAPSVCHALKNVERQEWPFWLISRRQPVIPNPRWCTARGSNSPPIDQKSNALSIEPRARCLADLDREY
ncbi:unnamed protein product [Schistocephalus solidus]|uniref:Transposase n=1 Tax=Schistocephalus solidus TaxID=70667 RepID=A0A183T139_SCHSO|nr:unnamed protein product [Schistocephalus solidus]